MLRLASAYSRRLLASCTVRSALSRRELAASWQFVAEFSSLSSDSSFPANVVAQAGSDAKLSSIQAASTGTVIASGNSSILQPTAKAAERLRFLATKSGNARLMLRIAVYEGGCHGMEYKFKLEQDEATLEPDDTIIEAGGGARFVLDSVTVEKMRGSTIDYLQDLQGEMFAVVHNPLASAACGCGSSFSPKA